MTKLISALIKVQAALKPAHKDGVNPHFRSKFASLESVIEASRDLLVSNDLAITQTMARSEDGTPVLITTLYHVSGEKLESAMPLFLAKPDMQGLGAAITYARRFSIVALLGVAQEDDDGEKAVGRIHHELKTSEGAGITNTPNRKNENSQPAPSKSLVISEKQMKRLWAIAKESNWTAENVKNFVQSRYKCSVRELPWVSYDECVKFIEAEKIKEMPDFADGELLPFEVRGNP